MTVPAVDRHERRLAARPAMVAVVAVLVLVTVALAGVFAPAAYASPLVRPQNAVGVIAGGAGQVVGAHQPVLAGQARAKAPDYDGCAIGSCVAAETSGARFVAGSNGVVTDLVGEAPNAVSLGHYPEYVDLGAQTGARTFSMSDEAWSAMSPEEQWVRNQSFLDRAIANGSEFRLATPLDAVRPGSFYERELQYLFKQGFVPNAEGTALIPGAP